MKYYIHSFTNRTVLILTLLGLSTLLYAGADTTGNSVNWILLITSLFGGLGMFLYGMEMMSDGMKVTAGNKMRTILEKLTSNRFLAVGVGAFVTMVIQSSSATTVMLVSFVNSGLLSFAQGLGVILGSNIGSTVTAQIVAFKITDYALVLIAIGAIMSLFSKKDTAKNIGFVILGFGLLFYGMKVMSDTMKPLRSNPTFNSILVSFENPFMGILAGAVFTALVQSSSATTGIVITLASGGSITLEAGIPLIFGANIGTCVTALLAGLNASREAKRVAIAHVTFNVIGVAVFCFWIPTFADIVAQTSDNVPRQIANAHTIFNIIATVIFIPFTTIIADLIIRFFPDKEEVRNIEKAAVLNLDESVLSYPAAAISNTQAEIRGVVGLMERVIGSLVNPFISDELSGDVEDPDQDFQKGLYVRLDKIGQLNQSILDYLVKISNEELNENQSREIFTLVSVVNYLESIRSAVEMRYSNLMDKKETLEGEFSEDGQNDLAAYHLKMIKQLSRIGKFFKKYNPKKAEKIVAKGEKYKDLEEKYRLAHINRASAGKTGSSVADHLHLELMDLLKEISVFIDLIASSLLQLQTIDKELTSN
tara:strand:+ start:567 stop:2345 length:1779 start_codon:yes stop_codon:yes gene_type:complete